MISSQKGAGTDAQNNPHFKVGKPPQSALNSKNIAQFPGPVNDLA